MAGTGLAPPTTSELSPPVHWRLAPEIRLILARPSARVYSAPAECFVCPTKLAAALSSAPPKRPLVASAHESKVRALVAKNHDHIVYLNCWDRARNRVQSLSQCVPSRSEQRLIKDE